jgi:hypothetical protein
VGANPVANFNTTGLGADPANVIGFRADRPDDEGPSGSAIKKSTSDCIDLRIGLNGTASPCDNYPNAQVVPVVTKVAGDGTPPPGSSGPWTITITIYVCMDKVLVQYAQGGSNGWTTVSSVVTSPNTTEYPNGIGNPPSDCENIKTQGNSSTQVILCLWGNKTGTGRQKNTFTGGVEKNTGDTLTVTFTESGTIPDTAPNGQVRCLLGKWSVTSSADGVNFVKSPYTDQASVTVANPDVDGSSGDASVGCS